MFHTAKSNKTISVVLFTYKNSNINDRSRNFQEKKKRKEDRLG